MGFKAKLTDLCRRFREEVAFQEIVRRYRKNGHRAPHVAAVHEIHMRAELEEFRDFASAAYVADPTLPLKEIKARWTPVRLRALGKVPGQFTDASLLRTIIRDMPVREMFHGDAIALWDRRAKERQAAIMADVRKDWDHPHRSPRTRRILRAA